MPTTKSKAIIFDIDGTAMPVGEGNWPSDRLRQAITAVQENYHVCTATGRSLQYAKDLIAFLELKDPCIIAAGTEIYDPLTKKIIWREAIPIHTYTHIQEVFAGNTDHLFSGDVDDDAMLGKDSHKLLDGTTAVLYLVAVEENKAAELTEQLQHPDLHIINMHSFWGSHLRDIHIHSAKASKEHAVASLLNILNVKKSDSIVAGDGLNDLHLFAAGGTKLAMGNAVPQLKEAADIVLKDITQDGLADFIEGLVV